MARYYYRGCNFPRTILRGCAASLFPRQGASLSVGPCRLVEGAGLAACAACRSLRLLTLPLIPAALAFADPHHDRPAFSSDRQSCPRCRYASNHGHESIPRASCPASGAARQSAGCASKAPRSSRPPRQASRFRRAALHVPRPVPCASPRANHAGNRLPGRQTRKQASFSRRVSPLVS